MYVQFGPLSRLYDAVFGDKPLNLRPVEVKYQPPENWTDNTYVVMDGVAITADEAIGISLIDGDMYDHIVVCREDGQLSYFKSGDTNVTVITRQQLVELIHGHQNKP